MRILMLLLIAILWMSSGNASADDSSGDWLRNPLKCVQTGADRLTFRDVTGSRSDLGGFRLIGGRYYPTNSYGGVDRSKGSYGFDRGVLRKYTSSGRVDRSRGYKRDGRAIHRVTRSGRLDRRTFRTNRSIRCLLTRR